MAGPADSPLAERVRSLVAPIVADLRLDLYDVEQRGGTLRITIDTPPGSPAGVDLDTLALATRLVSRELDHEDPVPGRYTLEVTSPGVERSLRTPAHFRREIGKTVSVRLADVGHDDRRLEGLLVAADDEAATVQVTDPHTGERVERVVPYHQIDRARTVFVWGPAPKPGGRKPSAKRAKGAAAAPTGDAPAKSSRERRGGPDLHENRGERTEERTDERDLERPASTGPERTSPDSTSPETTSKEPS